MRLLLNYIIRFRSSFLHSCIVLFILFVAILIIFKFRYVWQHQSWWLHRMLQQERHIYSEQAAWKARNSSCRHIRHSATWWVSMAFYLTASIYNWLILCDLKKSKQVSSILFLPLCNLFTSDSSWELFGTLHCKYPIIRCYIWFAEL